MIYTKEKFKELWDSPYGGGITFDDIADCAKDWGLYNTPKVALIYTIANKVLIAAGCDKYFEEELIAK